MHCFCSLIADTDFPSPQTDMPANGKNPNKEETCIRVCAQGTKSFLCECCLYLHLI